MLVYQLLHDQKQGEHRQWLQRNRTAPLLQQQIGIAHRLMKHHCKVHIERLCAKSLTSKHHVSNCEKSEFYALNSIQPLSVSKVSKKQIVAVYEDLMLFNFPCIIHNKMLKRVCSL